MRWYRLYSIGPKAVSPEGFAECGDCGRIFKAPKGHAPETLRCPDCWERGRRGLLEVVPCTQCGAFCETDGCGRYMAIPMTDGVCHECDPQPETYEDKVDRAYTAWKERS